MDLNEEKNRESESGMGNGHSPSESASVERETGGAETERSISDTEPVTPVHPISPIHLIAPISTEPTSPVQPVPYSSFRFRQLFTLTGIILLILAYACFSRFYALGEKPLHHDESLFSYYSFFLYQGHGYLYQPILHGPVLEHVVALIFLLFSDTNFTMRLWSAVGGLLLLLVAWDWRRYLGRAGLVASLALIALSPSITYYSRFLRNDVPYLTATVWTALCLVRLFHTGAQRYVWGAVLGATLMFSMMESSIFFFAACAGYLGMVALTDWFWGRDRNEVSPKFPGDAIIFVPQTRDEEEPDSTVRFLKAATAAVVLELAVAWLFYRILYGSIHIYKPFLKLLKPIFPSVTAEFVNWGIVIAAYPAFLVLCLAVASNFRRPRGRRGAIHYFLRVWWQNRWALLASVALGVGIYQTLFTTFFTNLEGPEFNWETKAFDGPVRPWTAVQIYKNTWDYWWDQHSLHRIKGPFHYYLPILFLYELPAIMLVVWGWWRAVRSREWWFLHVCVFVATQLLFASLYLPFAGKIDWTFMDEKFHLTSPAHLFLILLYVQILTHLTALLYRSGRLVESFVTFWMVTSLFAYSYAGEKVPWLTVHVAGPLCLLAGIYAHRLWRETTWTTGRRVAAGIAICFAVVWQLRSNVFLQFVHPYSPAERLVYNHTSPDIELAVEKIEEMGHASIFGKQLPMLIKGEMEWPLYWYLRHWPNAFLATTIESEENTTRPIVLVNWEVSQTPNLVDNYDIQRLKIREWWEPPMLEPWRLFDIHRAFTPNESRENSPNGNRYELAKQEWKKLWHYLAYRHIWLDPGNPDFSNGANEFAFCVRKDFKEQFLRPGWVYTLPKRRDIPVYP